MISSTGFCVAIRLKARGAKLISVEQRELWKFQIHGNTMNCIDVLGYAMDIANTIVAPARRPVPPDRLDFVISLFRL